MSVAEVYYLNAVFQQARINMLNLFPNATMQNHLHNNVKNIASIYFTHRLAIDLFKKTKQWNLSQ